MNLRSFILAVLILTFSLLHNVAHAARNFTYAQSPATAAAIFSMGSVQTLSYQVANTSTGGNAGERIYEMRFNLPGTGTVFSSSTTAPAGWTRTAYSTVSVTFRATSWATAIAVGGTPVTFSLNLIMRSSSADINDSLKSLRASYTDSTTGNFNRTGRNTTNTTNLWTLKSLAITSFQTTDTLGNPITALAAGSSFRLVMTIKNNSTVSVSNIVSNPNPPTAFPVGTITQVLTSTVGSPLTPALAPGASGTITFTYSTVATDSGTIYFTATARSGPNITSALATSNTLAISRFIANFPAFANSCLYAGANFDVTMDLSNGYPYNLNNVTTNLAAVSGAPVTKISGPSPPSPIAIAASSVISVTSVYQVNSNVIATDPFTFSGGATGTGITTGSPTHTTPPSTSFPVTRGEFPVVVNPAVTNAGSGNVQLTWTLTNNGCAAVNSVAIAIPAGWTWANEAYSLVTLSGSTSVETWVASGTNTITFTASVGSQLPLTFSGDFSLVFSATPAAAEASNFTVTVTDAAAGIANVPVTVTVNAYRSGLLNNATPNFSREEFR